MALGIKSLYSVRDIFPQKTRKLLLNALVVSHLHYSAILLSGISENLLTTLEKQINWGIKACFNRLKYDHSSDLKVQHDILPSDISFKAKMPTSTGNGKTKNFRLLQGK